MEITRIGPVSILWITPRYQKFTNLCDTGKKTQSQGLAQIPIISPLKAPLKIQKTSSYL